MKERYPENSPEARKAARKRRRRRLKIFRAAIVLTVVLILALVIALIVLRSVGIAASKRGETTSFLAVKTIEVEGESRYANEDIIRESGIYVGQSLLAVNKVQAHDALMNAFPYLEWVEVGNSSFDTVRIRLREATVLGAVQLQEDWMILGSNNHGLERLPSDALPAGIMQIVGASLQNETLGQELLDERSLRICSTIIQAADAYGLEGVTAIDITEKTNIHLMWKGRIRVVLGNESNLDGEIQRLPSILESMLQNNGEEAEGRLDMSSYADDDPDNDRAVFTPIEVLEQKAETGDSTTATDNSPEDGDTTTGAAQSSAE